MAYFVNKQNVVSYCVVKNDEILFLKLLNSNENSLESHELKCPVSEKQDAPKGSNVNVVKEHQVIAAAVSNCGKFLTACDTDNFLHLWHYDGILWSYKSQRKLIRKCHKIIFTNSGVETIVVDRSGDVFVFSVVDFQKEGVFLLGHVSLIVDIALSEDDRYLLTCDRDGKVRVSYYPNAYNIYGYCLGHEEFVSSVQSVKLSQELILSASGDGTLRLWNFSGDSICTINVYENEVLLKDAKTHRKSDNLNGAPTLLNEKQIAFAIKRVRFHPKSNMCAVLFYSVKGIAIYRISDSENISFIFVRFISLEEIPYDAIFNANGDIIILENGAGEQYSYLKYTEVEDCKTCFLEKASIDDSVFSDFKKLCGRVENLLDLQDDCEMLFKRKFDDKDDSTETSKGKKNKIA